VTFASLLTAADVRVAERHRLFVLLSPAAFGIVPVDFTIAAIYKILGLAMKCVDAVGRAVGWMFYHLDRILLRRGFLIPNHDLFVLTKSTRRP
jgi:hypothetical protein